MTNSAQEFKGNRKIEKPDPEQPDIDNLVKSALDALNGIVWHDDSQICALEIKKQYSFMPRIELEVSIIKERLLI